jgi:chromosome segregation ATPase
MKSEIDRLESIRLGQEETSRESFSVIQNYQSKTVELERRLIEKHDEIFRMREEIQNVNQDLAVKENSYQKNYLSMQRMTVQLKKEKQELEHLFEETSYELDTIKSNLSKTIKEKNRLQQALDDTNSELGSLVAHINEKSQVIEQHSKEIALKNQAYEKLSAELQKTKASSENAEEELSKLLEAMINFEKSETTKDHTISNLLEESEALKLEISTLKASLVDMQKRLESDIDTLKKENRNLSEELGKLKEENAAGRNYFDLAEERSNELEKLRGKLTMSESYCKSLEETIVTMRSDLMKNDVEMIPESESADLKRLQDDLLTSQKQKAELEKRVEHMAKLLSKAESIIARTNTITLSSVMETFRKKDANSLHSHDLLKKI